MKKNMMYIMFLFFAGMLLGSVLVHAAPSSPTSLTRGADGRFGLDTSSKNTTAFSGNTTGLNFNATTITQTWQGYFGNVTGKIVLGNSNNQTFYNWSYASVRGEIYATRISTVPSWSTIACASAFNVSTEDTFLGTNQVTDSDAANNTFVNTTSFTNFAVGAVQINNTDNCYATNLYDGTGNPTSNFNEVLLHDGSGLIYTSILNNGATGFDGGTHNFQMLVGDDGHNGNTATTLYYFYLELG